jgi:hypothetical protein
VIKELKAIQDVTVVKVLFGLYDIGVTLNGDKHQDVKRGYENQIDRWCRFRRHEDGCARILAGLGTGNEPSLP